MTGCVETRFALTMLSDIRARMARAEADLVTWLASLAADPDPYRDGTGELGKDWIVEDVAAALRVPSATAAAKLHVAAQLRARFPATLQALHDGRLDLRSAAKLVEATEALPDAVVSKLEADALDGVESRTHAQFAARLRTLVSRADPRTAEQQHQTQREQRRVVFTHLGHGMVELWALLPADQAAPLQAEVRRRADLTKHDPCEHRSADQRRADALCDLTTGATGARPTVNVTVPISTLLGDTDEPGHLDGHGPITAGLARALANDPTGTWRRLVTDSYGRLVDVTSRRYTPPARMQRLVELRDGTCRFPTCRRTATACELDHVIPWAKGGKTTPANLIPLCSRHHHLKHDGNWTVQRLPDGTVRWTSPTGHTHDRPPPDPLTG